MTDVEMKDAPTENQPAATAAVEEQKEPQDKYYGEYFIAYCVCFPELKKNFVLLEKAAQDKDFRMAGVLTKNLKKLRKSFSLCDVLLVLKFYLPDLYSRLGLSA